VSLEYLREKASQVKANLIIQEIDNWDVTAHITLADSSFLEAIIHELALPYQFPKLLPYNLLLLILIIYR
jgi:hypothetical protein